jgi:hypothetical protein
LILRHSKAARIATGVAQSSVINHVELNRMCENGVTFPDVRERVTFRKMIIGGTIFRAGFVNEINTRITMTFRLSTNLRKVCKVRRFVLDLI